jgi:hypothetical protein
MGRARSSGTPGGSPFAGLCVLSALGLSGGVTLGFAVLVWTLAEHLAGPVGALVLLGWGAATVVVATGAALLGVARPADDDPRAEPNAPSSI